ncbi:hypothetical protein SH580_00815 [Coraliomargarita algicola]|uniref:Uncharacterized protein n=1 Tax=Coraliomargarita algicola TaxID=3092156 RepID=A0ABZ0RJJ2_9BACT|nr:hypothetical protein [Coraliomargarita sp. J2-16]WPJ96242.1 hypothetical protein SH580_00815 [Coraliomargarita sp. J2-16]
MKTINKLFCSILLLMTLQPWCAYSATVNDHSTTSGATSYVLKGTVMDTSDNWLNVALISLAPLGAKTRSDANGEFTLEFEIETPLQPNKRKQLARLIVEREGHVTKKIPIKSMDYFTAEKPIEIKLEPLPVDSSLLGFSVEMESPEGRKGTEAQFHVYIPESIEKVRAAFYISRHGMGDLTKSVLRAFAEEEGVALVGMYGDPVQRGVDDVAILDQHLQRLAELSGHPELPHVPIMTFGHSNGTGFAASWPRDRPEQVIAWVAFHPGFSNYLQYPNTETVPAMVMCGTADKYLLRSRQDEVVAKMRQTRDAAMCVMMEGGVGHGPADADATWEFITEYLKAAMRIRLAEDGTLKPVDIEAGWLGAVYDFEAGGRQALDVAPYTKFKGDRSTANWLPDGAFAEAWQSYGK